jgi:E3 ubiquitin-protein ligase RNF19A
MRYFNPLQLACISIPAMIIGIPSYVGRKIHDKFKYASKIKRNLAVVGGVVGSVILSPALAVLVIYSFLDGFPFW